MVIDRIKKLQTTVIGTWIHNKTSRTKVSSTVELNPNHEPPQQLSTNIAVEMANANKT